MDLSKLGKIKGITKKSKRLGRGIGSGKGGHTVGRGNKGQKARGGKKPWLGFEGGQVPLYKRMPQIGGFKNYHTKDIVNVNIYKLEVFKEGSKVTPKLLVDKNIIERVGKGGVKILSNGKLSKKLILKGFTYSASAKKYLEKIGCSLEG